MSRLIAIWECPKCGDITENEVDMVEIIDTERDDVWIEPTCSVCGSSVLQKIIKENGENFPVFQEVLDEDDFYG
jgi:NAD-dependent SIR2 family protein deacetylase